MELHLTSIGSFSQITKFGFIRALESVHMLLFLPTGQWWLQESQDVKNTAGRAGIESWRLRSAGIQRTWSKLLPFTDPRFPFLTKPGGHCLLCDVLTRTPMQPF